MYCENFTVDKTRFSSSISRGVCPDPWKSRWVPVPGIDKMLDFDRLDSIAKHLILNLAIGHGKAVMLSLMFGPGINLEAFEVGIRSFCIDKDSPTRRAIAATNPLIFMDLMEKLRGLCWIDHDISPSRGLAPG